MSNSSRVELIDQRPAVEDGFLADVLLGLASPSKQLYSKYFYDERGSQLFEQICNLDEYYLTRSELAIMERHAEQMARRAGPRCLVVEYGSGASTKTRLLLEHLDEPAAYVPIDISREHLASAAARLAEEFSGLEVLPLCADFSQPFELPQSSRRPRRPLAYFPGSTLGNFQPHVARQFLAGIAATVGSGGGLLIGVDLKKDRARLERAYNDRLGVTAEFNLNLLARINRELDGDFDLDEFEHQAIYNESEGRIEMYLISRCRQRVSIGEAAFEFAAGERICTEWSYKFDLEQFARIAADSGWRVDEVWTDPQRLFSVQMLTAL